MPLGVPNSGDQAIGLGVLLAGGASARMGQDKRRLLLGHETLLERAIARLRQEVGRVWILTEPDHGLEIADCADGCVEWIADASPGRGPLAALAGLPRLPDQRPVAVMAVDLPGLPSGLFGRLQDALASAGSGVSVAVPEDAGRIEPLAAVYSPAALAAMPAAFEAGERSMQGFLRRLGPQAVMKLDAGGLGLNEGTWDRAFRNLNTPADLLAWRREVTP